MVDGVAPSIGAGQSSMMRACPELLRSCNGASVAGGKQGKARVVGDDIREGTADQIRKGSGVSGRLLDVTTKWEPLAGLESRGELL